MRGLGGIFFDDLTGERSGSGGLDAAQVVQELDDMEDGGKAGVQGTLYKSLLGKLWRL